MIQYQSTTTLHPNQLTLILSDSSQWFHPRSLPLIIVRLGLVITVKTGCENPDGSSC